MQKIRDKIGLWGQYAISIGLVVVIFILVILTAISSNNKEFVKDELTIRARSYFQYIVLTRQWNSRYGGVFVEKVGDMQSDPFLEHPDIMTKEGKVYTKKNPDTVTREIAALAAKKMGMSFHIASLDSINPRYKPQPFEISMLEAFTQGKTEAVSMVEKNGKTIFRYMAPLKVQKSCLAYHAKHGYKLGDVYGGISISFDVSTIENHFIKKNTYLFILAVVIAVLLLALLHLLTKKLKIRLQKAQEDVEKLAVTDELTGLYNRRYFFKRLEEEFVRSARYNKQLSVVMMDIDYFKRVNDRYGHLAGDILLHDVSTILQDNARSSDILARFGGEEFIILLPETSLLGAKKLAEKLRNIIANTPFKTDIGNNISITSSFGCSSSMLHKGTAAVNANKLIRKADKALYEAKDTGRNKVMAPL